MMMPPPPTPCRYRGRRLSLTNGGTFIVEETGAGMVPGSLANFATSIACIDDDSQQASGATVIDGRMGSRRPLAST